MLWNDDSDSDTSKGNSPARSDSSDDEGSTSRSHVPATSTTACVIRPSIGFHLDQNHSGTSIGSEARSTVPTVASSVFSISNPVLPSKMFMRGPFTPNPFNSRSISDDRPLPPEQQSATDPKPTSEAEGNSNQKTSIQDQAQQSSTASPGGVPLQSHVQSSEDQNMSNSSGATSQTQSDELHPSSEQHHSTPMESQISAAASSETVQKASDAEIQAVVPLDTNTMMAMTQSAPLSLHRFFSPGALAYPGTSSLHAQPPSSHSSQDVAQASAPSSPAAFRRKCDEGDSSLPTAHSSDGGDDSGTSGTPQAGTEATKKRRLKKDEERKRGTWRVQLDSATSVNGPSFSTLPGKPVFTIHQPILGETPLPYFEFKDAENRLISVVIEDTRFADREPSLFELLAPLRPDGNGAYWLDAAILCNTLQRGPARIDGPAKAYVFRGKYRQYFLRVSAENIDIYRSANLSVPTDLVLKVVVESTTLPTPTEDRFSASNGLLSQPPHLVKRRREQVSPERPRNDADSGANPPFARQQESPVSLETPRRSYYRKRAL